MRRTKSGAIHKHSLNIQDRPHVPSDPRQMLQAITRDYLGLLEYWNDGSKATGIVRAACKNLMEHLKGEQSS